MGSRQGQGNQVAATASGACQCGPSAVSARTNLEIFGRIVHTIAVLVMHCFMILQRPSQQLGHNMPMLHDPSRLPSIRMTGTEYSDITPGHDPSLALICGPVPMDVQGRISLIKSPCRVSPFGYAGPLSAPALARTRSPLHTFGNFGSPAFSLAHADMVAKVGT